MVNEDRQTAIDMLRDALDMLREVRDILQCANHILDDAHAQAYLIDQLSTLIDDDSGLLSTDYNLAHWISDLVSGDFDGEAALAASLEERQEEQGSC